MSWSRDTSVTVAAATGPGVTCRGRTMGAVSLRCVHGQGFGLAARGAPEGARRLGRLLLAVRRGDPLVRGVRGRDARPVPAMRRPAAAALPAMRGAVLVGGDRGL